MNGVRRRGRVEEPRQDGQVGLLLLLQLLIDAAGVLVIASSRPYG